MRLNELKEEANVMAIMDAIPFLLIMMGAIVGTSFLLPNPHGETPADQLGAIGKLKRNFRVRRIVKKLMRDPDIAAFFADAERNLTRRGDVKPDRVRKLVPLIQRVLDQEDINEIERIIQGMSRSHQDSHH